MKRYIENQLLSWKNSTRRKPLILRGARQVGKTYTIKEFGKKYFPEGLLHIDLERDTQWHKIFDGSLDPVHIKNELELLSGKKIKEGETLLFLDEIQRCPRAITALRYFYEEMPGLHVIAAGSLLEFIFSDFSFPVGRLQFLRMFPLSFSEFLLAAGYNKLAEFVAGPPQPASDLIHNQILEYLREYFFVGGMPEAIKTYITTGSIRESFEVHKEICLSYKEDFGKYSPKADPRCMEQVFVNAARSAGRQIKYTHLSREFSIPTVHKAFDILCRAGVINKIPSCQADALPLGAMASTKIFKAAMMDIGIMQHLCGIPIDLEYQKADIMSIYEGAMAEQFIAQELNTVQESLYYWSREKKNSLAEIDFLAVKQGRIIPIEVKSGPSGRLRSLHLFLRTYPRCQEGYVFSSGPYSHLPEQKLRFIPLYFCQSALNPDTILNRKE